MSDEGHAGSTHPKEGVVMSETIQDTSGTEALQVINFNFTPPTLFSGDCSLGADTLSVFSDGHCEWRANSVMSSDPGEDAFCCTFQLLDRNGISPWQFGRICSPTLNPTPIVWVDNNRLFYPSYMFPSIARAHMRYSC
jgi:hypothetical protein